MKVLLFFVLFGFFTLFLFSSLPVVFSYGYLGMHNSLSSPLSFTFALTKELFFQFVSVCSRPFFPHFISPSIHREGKLPIFLVHGYLERPSLWGWFRRALLQYEVGSIHLIALHLPYGSLEELALQLKRNIARLEGKKPCILIGHSMGGLVCSYYAECLEEGKQVEKVITIGSPFSGTLMARFGRGNSAKQMLPSSPFLCHLQDKLQISTRSYLYIASSQDNLIIPFSSALGVDNPHHQNLCFPHLGHISLLFSSDIVREIAQFLLKESNLSKVN